MVSEENPCYSCMICKTDICNACCGGDPESFDLEEDYEFDMDCNEASESEKSIEHKFRNIDKIRSKMNLIRHLINVK